MTHDHALLAQSGGDGRRVALRVARKNEVRRRRQNLEAARLQRRGHLFPAVDNLPAGPLEVLAILEGSGRSGNSDAIQWIRVEAVLDAFQRLDQLRMADRQTNPQPGQRARLGERLGHQQVRVTIDQGNRRLAAEIDIGLVDQHDGLGIGLQQPLDRVERQQAAGRRVRVGKDDAAVRSLVIGDVDLELLVQCNGFVGDAVQPAVDRIEAVADIRKQQRAAMLEQPMKRVRQHFVGTVTDEYLGRLHIVVVGDGLLEALTIGVRIQAQAIVDFRLHRSDRPRRRAVGVLVGVELDQLAQLGLLAWHIGHQVLDEGAPELAHPPFSPRMWSVCRRVENREAFSTCHVGQRWASKALSTLRSDLSLAA